MSSPSTPNLNPASITSWKGLLSRLRENRPAMIAYRILQVLVFIAIFADFLAYNKPYTAVYKGTRYFPIAADYLEAVGLYQWNGELVHAKWSDLELGQAFWPPVRYSPNQIDTDNDAVGPFAEQKVKNGWYKHFLGTQDNGKDLLSGLIHGTRISLSIGIVAMGIAGLIGIIIGSFAGFFGDHQLKITRAGSILLLMSLPFAFFYGFQVRTYLLKSALASSPFFFLLQLLLSLLIFLSIMALFWWFSRLFDRFRWLGKRQYLPLDLIISRILEIISSIPLLLLLMSLLLSSKQSSIYFTMVLIGLISWAGIAQFMRAEMLRVRNLEYVQAARSLGYSNMRILFKHALPNSLGTVLIICAFGVASAIGLESALSFLGIGIPEGTMTWGKMLNAARFDLRAWWLTLFPSLMIFVTITAMNLLGEGLRDALDPQRRRL